MLALTKLGILYTELFHMKRQYEQSNHQLSKNDQIVREMRSQENDFQEALSAKDSQLAILRVRFEESEKELQVCYICIEVLTLCLDIPFKNFKYLDTICRVKRRQWKAYKQRRIAYSRITHLLLTFKVKLLIH